MVLKNVRLLYSTGNGAVLTAAASAAMLGILWAAVVAFYPHVTSSAAYIAAACISVCMVFALRMMPRCGPPVAIDMGGLLLHVAVAVAAFALLVV